LNYNVSDTSGTAVLQDIVSKCRANQDLKVNYELKVSNWTSPFPMDLLTLSPKAFHTDHRRLDQSNNHQFVHHRLPY